MSKQTFVNLYNKIADPIRRHPLIRKHPSAKELVKYSVVGNFSNFLDLGLYIALTRAFTFWHDKYLLANALTMVIGSASRFIFHKKWTFRQDGGSFQEQYLKFIIVLAISLVLTEFFLFFSVEYLSIHDILGKIISMGLVTAVVYYLTKIWVFKKNKSLH